MEGAGVGGELFSFLINAVGELLDSKAASLLALEYSREDSKLVLGLSLLLSCNPGPGDAIAKALFTKSTKLPTLKMQQHSGIKTTPVLNLFLGR